MKSVLAAAAAAALVVGMVPTQGQQLQKVTLNYPTRSGASWPLFLAKEGGYYQKHGLDVTLAFAGHPAGIAMVINGEAQLSSYNLESVMQASARDSSFTIVGSSVYRPFFALMSKKEVASVRDLKCRTI